MHIYYNNDLIWDSPVHNTRTVVEQDEIQETRLLGPDGQPYALRRPKAKLGFDLTPRNIK